MALVFPIVTASTPQPAVFAIFGVTCLLGVLVVRTRAPDTRVRSLEEIEAAGPTPGVRR